MDAIIHVLRCFEDPDIAHVEGPIDPLRDAEVVETELMLADLDSLEKRLVAAQKRARGGDKEAIASVALMEPLVGALREGRPGAIGRRAGPGRRPCKRLQLLTSKPVLYVCNVEEGAAASGNAFSARVRSARAQKERVSSWCQRRSRRRWRNCRRLIAASSWKGLACTTAASIA